MSTCNRLDLESHGSWPTMPQKLPWHWNKPSTLTFYQLWRKLWERYSPQTRIIETYHKQKHEIHLSLCILTMSWQESSDFMSCNANFLGTGTNLLHSHSLNFEGSYEKDTLLRRGGSKLITNESTKSISLCILTPSWQESSDFMSCNATSCGGRDWSVLPSISELRGRTKSTHKFTSCCTIQWTPPSTRNDRFVTLPPGRTELQTFVKQAASRVVSALIFEQKN